MTTTYLAPNGAKVTRAKLARYLEEKAKQDPRVGRLADDVRERADAKVSVGAVIRIHITDGETLRGEVDSIGVGDDGALRVVAWTAGQTRTLARWDGTRWVRLREHASPKAGARWVRRAPQARKGRTA